MNNCQQWNCPNMNIRGHCNITACSNPNLYNQRINISSQKIDSIIFPQTIGSITFYTSKELIDWVCTQQDKNYRIGNGT